MRPHLDQNYLDVHILSSLFKVLFHFSIPKMDLMCLLGLCVGCRDQKPCLETSFFEFWEYIFYRRWGKSDWCVVWRDVKHTQFSVFIDNNSPTCWFLTSHSSQHSTKSKNMPVMLTSDSLLLSTLLLSLKSSQAFN